MSASYSRRRLPRKVTSVTRWTLESPRGTPFWWEDAPLPEADDSAPAARVDIAIVGAGYTGLSAARVAADGGASVVVVDAGLPGAGASSRNGGMFGAHPRLGHAPLQRAFGSETADALFAEAPQALAWAKQMIADEGIDCDLQETGRISLAWTKTHAANQAALADKIHAKSSVQVTRLSRDAIKSEINTACYHGAMIFPDHCGLNPAKYVTGLIAAVRRRRVPVLAHCPVRDFAINPDGTATLVTPKGIIKADKVILATNGYTKAPFSWFAARVFPLPSFLIATEPLSPNLIADLAPGRRMMVETRARHSYYRVSPCGTRIIFGGRSSMVPIQLKEAGRRLHATMTEVWPQLRKTAISHVWTGNTGFTFDNMPHVGQQGPIHYAMGYSGGGTVMAPYLGAKAAYAALGDERAATAYTRTHLRRSWMHPTETPHFLQAANLWYRSVVDTRENLQAR